MKYVIFYMILFCTCFSVKSQIKFREDVFKYIKQDYYDSVSVIIEENIDSIIQYGLLNYNEVYLIYLLNDSLLIDNNLRLKLGRDINDSLHVFLFNKISDEYLVYQDKIEKLVTNKVEYDFHKLYLEIIGFPKDKSTFDTYSLTDKKNQFVNYYKEKIELCPDSIYLGIKSMRFRKVTKNFSIGSIYYNQEEYDNGGLVGYYKDDESLFYKETPKFGLGIKRFLSYGIIACEYGVDLNFFHQRYYHRQTERYSYDKIRLIPGLSGGIGAMILNKNNYYISTLAAANLISVLGGYNWAGFKTTISYKLKNRVSIYHLNNSFEQYYPNISLSFGYFINTDGPYNGIRASISYGWNVDKILKITDRVILSRW